VRRGHVALGLVEELERVPVRIGEAVRTAVPDVAVGPARPETRRLDRGDPPYERLRAPGTGADVPDSGLRRLGELQAVAEVVAPAAQVDRATVAGLLLHPEHLDEEAQALLRLRRQELGVCDVRDLVEVLGHAGAYSPATRRDPATIISRASSSPKPAPSRRSAHIARPSSTAGYSGLPKSLEKKLRSSPTARTPSNTCSNVVLPE